MWTKAASRCWPATLGVVHDAGKCRESIGTRNFLSVTSRPNLRSHSFVKRSATSDRSTCITPQSTAFLFPLFSSSSPKVTRLNQANWVRRCSVEAHTMVSTDRDTLPKVAKPVNYHVSLSDLKLGSPWTYRGLVKIDLQILTPSTEITLNCNEVEVHKADILKKDGTLLSTANNISYDKQSERVTLAFPQEIAARKEVILAINFVGVMNNSMAGFYRSKYKSTFDVHPDTPKEGDFYYMLSTQFESCDARRAFPCFDEPNLKATFDFEIEVPKGLVALSNMPVKSEREGSHPGLKVVLFDRTPVMSTYLLAWAVGDFEYVEAFTQHKYKAGKRIPVRVYTTRGLKDQGRFALECAHRTVDYFSELFDIEYPLPKSDLLAVHEFAMGAMENWGLVTYRTVAVLFDDASSDTRFKNRIAYVVAHELAHQWFGNLVTMDWWSELWLNEGFATWVGWLAVDHFHPEWKVWSQFVAEGYQTAFKLDSLRASHPIEVPVRNALEVDQIFDAISYLKGSSAIRMLSNYLGRDTFIRGVSNYLKAHAYGNATTNDLWAALSEASGQDVTAFMDPWIRKIGFPVVTVGEEPDRISVQQSRYLSSGDVKPEEDQAIWWIPLGLQTKSLNAQNVARALTTKSDIVRNVDLDFYKLNKDQSGFYRTNYPPSRLAQLGHQLDLLSVEDRIGLVGDASALAISGEGTTPAVLALLEGFQNEQNYLVWCQISNSLSNLRSVFSSDEKTLEGLKKFTLKLVSPTVQRLGWEFSPNEDYLTSQLRKLIIAMAGTAGHESVITEAKKRFHLWSSGSDPEAVHPNLRAAIFGINISEGDRPEFERVKEEYFSTTSVDGKDICLSTLARTKNPQLIIEYLDFIFSDSVATQDIHTGGAGVGSNTSLRHILWTYVRDNWQKVTKHLSGNNVVLDRFVRVSLPYFADESTEQDILSFFKDKDQSLFERGLATVLDAVHTNVQYKKRDEKVLLEWLQAHKYV